MEIKINFDKLDEIMRAFYSITGIKIIVFDDQRNYLHSYPKKDCAFCTKMKSTAQGLAKCVENDKLFLMKAESRAGLCFTPAMRGWLKGVLR